MTDDLNENRQIILRQIKRRALNRAKVEPSYLEKWQKSMGQTAGQKAFSIIYSSNEERHTSVQRALAKAAGISRDTLRHATIVHREGTVEEKKSVAVNGASVKAVAQKIRARKGFINKREQRSRELELMRFERTLAVIENACEYCTQAHIPEFLTADQKSAFLKNLEKSRSKINKFMRKFKVAEDSNDEQSIKVRNSVGTS